MALGQSYNNNKNNYSPTVYSNYKFNNGEATVDPSCLSCSFWNNMLKISIAPKKQTSGDEIAFDFDSAISIYLNHTKARILYGEIAKFLSDPVKFNSVGIPSGQGLVTIGSIEGKPCIVIRKINADGVTESSYAYQFKTDYYYSIRNYDETTADFDKITEDYKNIEIEQLLTLLQSYYEAATNALAYSVMEQSKYDQSRTNTKLELIANKLGVQFGKGGGGNTTKPAESIFNKKPATNYSSTTVDDITSQLG